MPLIIKRYSNRKLYNTHTRQYISLEDVALLVRQGIDVKVVDHASGEDQTALTLSQILLDQERKQSGYLPLPLLMMLVQTGGNALELVGRMFFRLFSLDHYVNEEIHRRLERLVQEGDISYEEGERLRKGLLNPESQKADRDSAIYRWINNYLEEQGYATRAEVERLNAEIEALNQKVERLNRLKQV